MAVPVVALVLAAGLAVFVSSKSTVTPKSKAAHRPSRVVPSTIVADCSKPVDAELNTWLASVPDGTDIAFSAGACYAQQESINLKNRADLVIDGRGATFKSSAPNDNSKLVPNWFLMRSNRITLRNMTIIGNFDDPGPPTPQHGSVTSNAGVGIFGGSDIDVADVSIRHVFGDGVSVANAYYHDPDNQTPEFSRNVHLERLDISKAARHCVSPSQVTGFWLEDSKLDDCYLDALDAEKDVISDPMSDLHVLNNTFTNYFGVGVVVPIGGAPGGPPAGGIEIKGNKFLTLPVASVCNEAIAIGGYQDQSFANVTIEGNEIHAWKVAIAATGVTTGQIRDNLIVHPAAGPTGNAPRVGDCGPDLEANVVLHDSPAVTTSNNG